MKLQAKISLILIVSMLVALVISFVLINVLAVLFDQSYSWYDLEKVALEVSRDLGADMGLHAATVAARLEVWKTRYPNLRFTVLNQQRELVYGTDRESHQRPDLDEIRRRLAQDQARLDSSNSSLRFIDTIDRSPYMVAKPVMAGDEIRGMLMVSVKSDFFLPFYIRINDDKIVDAYVIFIVTLAAVITLSFLLVFLFTTPIIRRLRSLYARINGFELGIPGHGGVQQPLKDEIGFIQNTFNSMAERILKDYTDRMRFFQERQELLRSISHDFRTPLTSILGYAVSLDEGVYDSEEEQKKYFSIIRKKAEYMTRLFDEMMELTRLDSGASLLKQQEFNLAELVREIIIEYIPQLEATSFVIENEIPEILMIRADRERLSRALRNLIDNVVTHAATGKYLGVFLSGENMQEAAGAAKGWPGIRLSIRDHGPGVADEDRVRIFDRFFSGRENSGTGLGLAIAKEIVEKHGGTIKIDDTDGPGAVFSVYLPARPEAGARN